MGPAENKQLLAQIYAEISRGDPQLLLDSLADDVEWTIIGNTVLSGVSRLADGPVVFRPERFIAEGEYVVMQARGFATARNGKPYNNTYCIVCRIVDGKVKEMTDYIDTEMITSVLAA